MYLILPFARVEKEKKEKFTGESLAPQCAGRIAVRLLEGPDKGTLGGESALFRDRPDRGFAGLQPCMTMEIYY